MECSKVIYTRQHEIIVLEIVVYKYDVVDRNILVTFVHGLSMWKENQVDYFRKSSNKLRKEPQEQRLGL